MNATLATPEYRAALAATLFVSAFNTVYEDDEKMRLTLHRGDGTSVAVTGELTTDYVEAFDASQVAAWLTALSAAIKSDPDAVLSVTSWLFDADAEPMYWAWRVADGAPLEVAAAAALFGEDEVYLYQGAEEHWVKIRDGRDDTSLMDISEDGLAWFALTDGVKAALISHATTPECGVCGDEGCADRSAPADAYCALCGYDHASHRFRECATFARTVEAYEARYAPASSLRN